ncbi:MAG: hypothetical protein LAN71_17015 [Acidobacteriia bacterium]|nr:hypothetical protein [Terriglobia bacterium]
MKGKNIWLHGRCPVVRQYFDDNPDKLIGVDTYTQDFAKAHISQCDLCRRYNQDEDLKNGAMERLIKRLDNSTTSFRLEDLEDFEDKIVELMEKWDYLKQEGDGLGIHDTTNFLQMNTVKKEMEEYESWLGYLIGLIRYKEKNLKKG